MYALREPLIDIGKTEISALLFIYLLFIYLLIISDSFIIIGIININYYFQNSILCPLSKKNKENTLRYLRYRNSLLNHENINMLNSA